MSKKHPRHLLVLSTTTILTLLLSAPAFAADSGFCSRDPSGAFVDAKGIPLNEEQISQCLNQLAPAAGDDGGESSDDQNGDYDNDVPGTPSETVTDDETPPPNDDTTGEETPPPDDDTSGEETPPPNDDTSGDNPPPQDEDTTSGDNNQPA